MNKDEGTENKENNGQEQSASFSNEIELYIKHLDALRETIPLIMELVSGKIIKESKSIDSFVSINKLQEKEDNGKKSIFIPAEKINEFFRLNDKLTASIIAGQYLPINFVVAMVSQYDAYLGRLIRTIFLTKPEILNASEKSFLFSELVQFKSLEEAREFVIEKEVESVLRESHLKQFKWLENKLAIKLREDLPNFVHFIEITERRNLFVHCNGVVSRQYILNCKESGVNGIDKIKIGDQLKAGPKYLWKSYYVLLEIGVKLGQVIWRKLLPGELEKADLNLIDICFELLVKGQYKLAINLLNFATETLKKHCNQDIVLVFVINKALAYYLSEDKEECNRVLDKQDWSATSDSFKLAVSVLREQYTESAKLMEVVGPKHERFTKVSYMEWPLFKTFRETNEFKEAYKKVFNEDFIYKEERPQKLAEVLDEIRQLKSEAQESLKTQETLDITPKDSE